MGGHFWLKDERIDATEGVVVGVFPAGSFRVWRVLLHGDVHLAQVQVADGFKMWIESLAKGNLDLVSTIKNFSPSLVIDSLAKYVDINHFSYKVERSYCQMFDLVENVYHR